MKYDLEINIEAKDPTLLINFRLPAPIVRDFKWVAKQNGVSMTHVMTKMLQEFVNEYRNKGIPKQKSLF